MIRYKRRFLILALFSALLVIFSGCSGGGSSKPQPTEHAEVKEAIQKATSTFVSAVENYVVEDMLKFLDKDNFTLVIKENGQSLQENKDYALVEAELQEDAEKQLRWRKDPPEGYGYSLTMELGTIVFSNISSTGAIATTTFKIFEQAQGIPKTLTDTGQIVLEMVKLEGKWLCRKMNNNFDKIGNSIMGQGIFGEQPEARGFGFSLVGLD